MFKNQKGITLIALIITIIVLLILAGVTIAQIAGNESAPNKAVEAREKNKQGAEFDAIKLAAVSSIADGDYTLHVNEETLKRGLTGLIQENPEDVITAGASEWVVTGNSGVQYKITNLGYVGELLTMDKATISAISVDVGSSTPLTISNASEIEEIESCSIAKVTPTGGTETTVASVAKSSTTGIWEITGLAIPTVPADAESVETTLTVTGKSGATKEVNLTVNKPASVAKNDEIDFKVDLIGTTTDADWIILYDGTNDNATEKPNTSGKIFAILKDYLPNTKRTSLGIGTGLAYDSSEPSSKPYNVWNSNSSTKADGLVKMLNGTDGSWDALIDSNITSKETTNGKKVQVVGAIDKTTMDEIKGSASTYYKPSSASSYSTHNCQGYWLASPISTNIVYLVDYNGNAGNYRSSNTNIGVCPVVILPSDIPLKKANGVWEVDTTKMVTSNS